MSVQEIRVQTYLVVRADGKVRVVKTRPNLRMDEVAFPVTVTIPKTWGLVVQPGIDLALPEPPEARVTVGGPELDTPDDP